MKKVKSSLKDIKKKQRERYIAAAVLQILNKRQNGQKLLKIEQQFWGSIILVVKLVLSKRYIGRVSYFHQLLKTSFS